MANAAIEIVSLDAIKQELRIGGATEAERAAYTDHDTLLTGQIEAAVSFVEKLITAPLIDRSETCYAQPPARGAALVFRATHIKSVGEIRYWTPNGELRGDADGAIDAADLGRRYPAHNEYGNPVRYAIWPPAGGWPETLRGSLVEIDVTRGLDIHQTTKALRQAVVVAIRQFYDGYRELRPTEAVFALIEPWRRHD